MKTNEEMKNSELKTNEMEQVSGGNILTDLKEAVQNIFQAPDQSTKPDNPDSPKPAVGRGKC